MRTDRPFLDKHTDYPAEVDQLGQADGARARIGDLEIRVPGGVPGDRLRVQVRHIGQHARWGRLAAIEQPSPERVEAPCPVVLACGGCPWQMASLALQRRTREAAIRLQLGDLADLAQWHLWPGQAHTTGYRTRALMMVRKVAGELTLGFFAPGSHDMVPAPDCVVQHPGVTAALTGVLEVLRAQGMTAWSEHGRPGLLRAVLFRLDPDTNTGLLTLVVGRRARLEELAQDLLVVPEVAGVFCNVQALSGGAVLGPETEWLAGDKRQSLRWGDLTLRVGPTAFVQTRHDMAETLLSCVAGLLPARMGHLCDLYAGIGMFGLALAKRCEAVTLVERDAAAVVDAQRNAGPNVTVVEADAAEFVKNISNMTPLVDAVVLDPPRSGCAQGVLEGLLALPGQPVVVYVSCGPQSLARDLKVLTAGGFRITDVTLLDMFVHTPHVEVVVRLSR